MTTPVVDVHAHVLTHEMCRLMAKVSPALAPRLDAVTDETVTLSWADQSYRPMPRGFWDFETRLAAMDRAGVDVQVLSIVPHMFRYGEDAGPIRDFAVIQNDELSRHVGESDRFLGLANLPMQDPDLAALELRRCIETLGLNGAIIGATAGSRPLADPDLDALWAVADRHQAFIFIHPMNARGVPGVDRFYLRNIIGNPLDTTIAAANLVYGGVLTRFPNIRFCLAHGGGFLPFQYGRFSHGWNVRPESRELLQSPPNDLFSRFYYDTILHATAPLRYLVETMGADRVLLGSDYPADMGVDEGPAFIRSAGLSAGQQNAILGGNAAALFR